MSDYPPLAYVIEMHKNTIMAYNTNARRITSEVAGRYGAVTVDGYFSYLMEKSAELCTNTIRIYKRSICYALETDGHHGECAAGDV